MSPVGWNVVFRAKTTTYKITLKPVKCQQNDSFFRLR